MGILQYIDRLFEIHAELALEEDTIMGRIAIYCASKTQKKFGICSPNLSKKRRNWYFLIAGTYYYINLKISIKKYLKTGKLPKATN